MATQCLGLTNLFEQIEDPRIERTRLHLVGDSVDRAWPQRLRGIGDFRFMARLLWDVSRLR
jgi:hypothetical protein